MRRVFFALIVVLLLVLPSTSRAAGSKAARAALNTVLPEARFTNIPLADAIDFIRDTSGANIVVDWKALEALSIGKDTQLNMSLRQIRLEKLLDLVLNEAGPGDLLTYYIDDNVIYITSRAVADQTQITIVYYVDDIVSADEDFDPTINVTNSLSAGTTGTGGQGSGGGQGGSGGLFGSSTGSGSGSGSSTQTNSATTKAEKAKDLIKVIETVIRPEVWKDNGGNAAIEYFNGSLIVTAPRSVQEAIGGPVD